MGEAEGGDDDAAVKVSHTDVEAWPLAKLHRRLATLTEGGSSLKAAVLVTTGAQNPPHVGHAALLHKAQECVEKHGYFVLAAYLSPSHDLYVQGKARSMRTLALSSAFRVEVARLTVAADDIVDVATWESTQRGHWPDFPEVCANLQTTLAQEPQLRRSGKGVAVFYCCGTDHAEKCHLHFGMRSCGVVIVPRADVPTKSAARLVDRPEKSVFIAEPADGEVSSYSSTLVRKAMQDGDEAYLRRALSNDAVEFILAPTKAQQEMFADDFKVLSAATAAS